ncbi:hypothetical protein [uncultured Alteromonas sp.]|jgi:membrane protein YdbS with pleckstrin-like domain|uniref:hypothetical protein n=1 Tax=uncultured Alteromonas sp. TaxID=179113 RepID=UPI0025D4C30A|nr:hypothetical protein [uncultured Alteromonas sp.]
MKILKLATYLMLTIPVITQLYLLLSPLQKSSYGILMAGLVLLLISVCLLVILSRFVWRAHSDSA